LDGPATAPPGSSRFVEALKGASQSESPSRIKGSRKSTNKNYPRSKDDEDKDERIALVERGEVRRDSESADLSDTESTPIDHPGIRLVSSDTVI